MAKKELEQEVPKEDTKVEQGTETPDKPKTNVPVKKEVLPDGTIVEHF